MPCQRTRSLRLPPPGPLCPSPSQDTHFVRPNSIYTGRKLRSISAPRDARPCYITDSLFPFYSASMEWTEKLTQHDGEEAAQVTRSNRSAFKRPSPVLRARPRARVLLLVG